MKWSVLVVLTLVVASCGLGPGTATHDVQLTNATAERLTVYELQRGPGLSRVIESGATIKSSWPYPLSASDSRKARLEADDSSGVRVYCKDFSFAQLSGLDWKVVLRVGTNDC
jgi:hypothetical protein